MSPIQVLPVGLHSWERVIEAVNRVKERLIRSTAALERNQIAYAVAGGHAVAAWVAKVDEGAVRNTPDVDILVRRADLAEVARALTQVGFVHQQHRGQDIFLDGPEGTPRAAVYLWFAVEKVKESDPLPSPDLNESDGGAGGYRMLTLDALARMKLTAYRLKDQVHIQDMIGVGLIDATWPARFPPELAARLQTLLDDPNG